ncbi:MAG: hypothetical protein HOH89_03570 [Alphaproteobacteria bacterium]|jgi:hypothetical protein|nr:hypothetical protein [Alphaproteobacteria bacterium]MBT5860213.1 hypothetical protein [Alphaproteobacteria bacterium]
MQKLPKSPIQHRSTWRSWGLFVAAGLALAGCQALVEQQARACPSVAILADTDIVTILVPNADPPAVAAEATLSRVNSECQANDARVEVELAFQIDALRGATTDAGVIELPFFVAVTDGQGRVLGKDIFFSRLTFDESGHAAQVEQLVETIPLADGEMPVGFQIIVGFQLTPEELQYNQAR